MLTVLIEIFLHYVEKEEGEFFPKVRAQLGASDWAKLGLTSKRQKRPHLANLWRIREADSPGTVQEISAWSGFIAEDARAYQGMLGTC